jgi:succinoglycan biosynthesis protein ExoM
MDHITVCICTYKRPGYLTRLLDTLSGQVTENLFTYSIVVVDNDREKSAREIVESFKAKEDMDIEYYTNPEKNIAKTRNTGIIHARGDYCAFIDDDEFPIDRWLLNHYHAINEYNITAVLGPVLPHYEGTPSSWLVKSRLCERKRSKTGTILDWRETRTGNVLIRRTLFDDPANHFDLSFGNGGEDVDFFRRLMKKGHKVIWCDEASVYESVPSERMTLSYFVKRAYLGGFVSYQYMKGGMSFFQKVKVFVKAFTAVILYALIMPFLLLGGFHLFARFLVKWTNHFSRCLAVLNIIKKPERGF